MMVFVIRVWTLLPVAGISLNAAGIVPTISPNGLGDATRRDLRHRRSLVPAPRQDQRYPGRTARRSDRATMRRDRFEGVRVGRAIGQLDPMPAFTELIPLTLVTPVALTSAAVAELSATRQGEQLVVRGDHFRISADATKGGQITELRLFDGSDRNCVLGSDVTNPPVECRESLESMPGQCGALPAPVSLFLHLADPAT